MKIQLQLYTGRQEACIPHVSIRSYFPWCVCKNLFILKFQIGRVGRRCGLQIDGRCRSLLRQKPAFPIFSWPEISTRLTGTPERAGSFPVIQSGRTWWGPAAAASGKQEFIRSFSDYIRTLRENDISSLIFQIVAAKKFHSVGALSFCGVASLN